jgi:hypothetical protein
MSSDELTKKFMTFGVNNFQISKNTVNEQEISSSLNTISERYNSAHQGSINQQCVEAYWIGNDLLENFDIKNLPYHNYTVLKYKRDFNCLVLPAKILEIVDKLHLIVSTVKITYSNNKYSLEEDIRTVVYDIKISDPVIDSDIAIHWGTLIVDLTNEQKKLLELYLEKILFYLNNSNQ